MDRLEWLKEQKVLFEVRARRAAYPSFFGYAIRVYDGLIEKEEKKR